MVFGYLNLDDVRVKVLFAKWKDIEILLVLQLVLTFATKHESNISCPAAEPLLQLLRSIKLYPVGLFTPSCIHGENVYNRMVAYKMKLLGES